MNKLVLLMFINIIISLFTNSGFCIPIELSSSSSTITSNIPDSTTELSSSSSLPSLLSLKSSSSGSHLSHNSPYSTSAAHERTLLITQKWLIDNINLLRREMSEMARDYNQHIDANKQEVIRKESEFARDVDSLRADHTFLARNQLQIINLIKNNNNQGHQKHQQNEHGYQSETSENEINNDNQGEIIPKQHSESHKSRKHLRHLVYDLMKGEATFESQVKHNFSSISSQLNALHQITISLNQDLNELQSKIRSVDFDALL